MRTVARRVLGLIVVALLASVQGRPRRARATRAACAPCAHERLPAGYVASVKRALRSGKDVWGNELLRSPTGPTYDGAARHLRPLLLAARSTHRYLTGSGIYYLPFAWPTQFGAQNVALHVADGSGIFAQHHPRTEADDHRRQERGRALRQLPLAPRRRRSCADGYLPILETQLRRRTRRAATARSRSRRIIRETGRLAASSG